MAFLPWRWVAAVVIVLTMCGLSSVIVASLRNAHYERKIAEMQTQYAQATAKAKADALTSYASLQALSDARGAALEQAKQQRDAANAKIAEQWRVIRQRPVYSQCKLDADGMRISRDAERTAGLPASEAQR